MGNSNDNLGLCCHIGNRWPRQTNSLSKSNMSRSLRMKWRSGEPACIRSYYEELCVFFSNIPKSLSQWMFSVISPATKTNKHRTLMLAKKTQPLHARHLVLHFDYAPGTARSYLSHLGRQGLLERVRGGYALTNKGHDRIRYFDVFGCGCPGCPFCKGKSGYLTCPNCGNRISKQGARICNEKDFFLLVRHAGVYCDACSALILDEMQACKLGIQREK
jgi:hypothetical protein